MFMEVCNLFDNQRYLMRPGRFWRSRILHNKILNWNTEKYQGKLNVFTLKWHFHEFLGFNTMSWIILVLRHDNLTNFFYFTFYFDLLWRASCSLDTEKLQKVSVYIRPSSASRNFKACLLRPCCLNRLHNNGIILWLNHSTFVIENWRRPVPTESFNWFLSGLDWILSLEFC